MPTKRDIPCCIIAGGQSRRFGSNKAIATLGVAPLVEIAVSRLRAQTSAQIAINCRERSSLGRYADAEIHDGAFAQSGPLSGLLASMRWAKSLDQPLLLTIPVDTPFIPLNLLERFIQTGAPCISASQNRPHFLTGLWRTDDADQLESLLEAGNRSVSSWVRVCGAAKCEFSIVQGVDPFFNINTRDDLKRAETALNQLHDPH